MPDYTLPDFASASEFMASSTGEVSHGDCAWLIVLAAFHSFNPTRYPLSGDALAALRDDAIAHGYADASGAVNIPSLDAYLHDRGVPHGTFCSYASARAGYPPFAGGFDLEGGLHNVLRQFAATPPLAACVCVETSTASAGLPEDNPNVFYHYFGVGGIKLPVTDASGNVTGAGGYYRADGDAVAVNLPEGGIPPILTGWGEIVATTPVGYILIGGTPPAPNPPAPPPQGESTVTWTAEKDASGNVVGAHDSNGAHAGEGDAHILLDPTKNYQGTTSLIPIGEAYWSQGHSVLALSDDRLILAASDGAGNWSFAEEAHGGEAFAALYTMNQQAHAVIVGLQSQLAQAQGAGGQMSLADAIHITGQALLQVAASQGIH